MPKGNTVARHRLATRPITPLTGLTQTAEFGRIAIRRGVGVTATGLAITATFMGAANAAPAPTVAPEPVQQELNTLLADDSVGTIVAVDEAWDPGDEVAAVAAEPEPEPEPEPVVETRTADTATRSSRSQSTESQSQAAPVETVSRSVDGSSVVGAAYSLVGIPYSYAGESLGGLDCSGLVKLAYGAVGINLPHSSGAIYSMGTKLPLSAAQPGDIIYYPGHVAIYVGGGMMVEATTPGNLSTVASVRGGGTVVRI